ncbi:MAG: hypothetical protein AB7K36_30795, partial [Chloroflexota bacterium]
VDGELRIRSFRESIRRVQERVRPYIRPGESIVDELIAERRAEALPELSEIHRYMNILTNTYNCADQPTD